MSKLKKIAIGIGGSSGSIYAKLLLDALSQSDENLQVGVVMSTNAVINWELELGPFDKAQYPFTFYENSDFFAPFASGSAKYDAMVLCPCSMGLVARVASGFSNDLLSRAADVFLKERRKLIVVPRESPFSLIHLRNLTTLAEAGAVILPASPSYYSQPKSLEEAAMTVVSRILDHIDIEHTTFRWGEKG
jgi:flavin prenyltransferase